MRQTSLSIHTLEDPTYRMALKAVAAAEERKAGDILLLDVQNVSTLADYFLVVTGYSHTQVRAIATAIQEKLQAEGQLPRRIEGLQAATWVLLDYADIIVHILTPQERDFYDLDAFWGEACRVELDSYPHPL